MFKQLVVNLTIIGRAKKATFLAGIFCLFLSHPAFALSAMPQAGSRQDTAEKLGDVLNKLEKGLDAMDSLLTGTGTAHRVLHDDMGSAMPEDLAQDLTQELDVLILLRKAMMVFSDLLKEEHSLLDGKATYSIADVQKSIDDFADGLQKLREAIGRRSLQRREYKKRLTAALDSLTTANPQKEEIYRTARAYLDPDSLDNLLSKQQAYLQGIQSWLVAFRGSQR